MEVIVTFLVLLELMKTGKILVEQESVDDEIVVISNQAQEADTAGE
jgi:segregation and condensation protein A